MSFRLVQTVHSINPFVSNETEKKCAGSDKVLFVVYPVLFGATIVAIAGCFFVSAPLNFYMMAGLGAALPLYGTSFLVHAYFIQQKKRTPSYSIEKKFNNVPETPIEDVPETPIEDVPETPIEDVPEISSDDESVIALEDEVDGIDSSPQEKALITQVSNTRPTRVTVRWPRSSGPISWVSRLIKKDLMVSFMVPVVPLKEMPRTPRAPLLAFDVPAISAPGLTPPTFAPIDLSWSDTRHFVALIDPPPRRLLPAPTAFVKGVLPPKGAGKSADCDDVLPPHPPRSRVQNPLVTEESDDWVEVRPEKNCFPENEVMNFLKGILMPKKQEENKPLSEEEVKHACQIKKKAIAFYLSEEFRWIREALAQKEKPASCEESGCWLGHEVLEQVCQTIYTELKEHWGQCSKGYPEGFLMDCLGYLASLPPVNLRSSQERVNVQFAVLSLLPFFFRFYTALGEKRTALLPWLKSQKQTFLSMLEIADKEKILRGLAQLNDTLFDALLVALTPLNKFFGKKKNYNGKVFLSYALDYLSSYVLPLLLNRSVDTYINEEEKQHRRLKRIRCRIKKAESIASAIPELSDRFQETISNYTKRKNREFDEDLAKMALQQVLANGVLPFLSDFILRPDASSINEYMKALDVGKEEVLQVLKTKKLVKKKGVKLERSSLKCPREDLLASKKTIDSLVAEEKGALKYIKETLLKDLMKNTGNAETYEAFVKDLNGIIDHFVGHLQNIVGKKMSVGDFVVKSLLLAEAFTDHFNDLESRLNLVKNLLEFFISYLKKSCVGKSELKALEALVETKFDRVKEGLSALDLSEEELAAFRIIPVQDLVLGLLLVFYGTKHFHQLRPFLSKHQKVLMALLQDSGIEQIQKHESKISWGLWFFLNALLPINGLINATKVPFKDSAIKTTCDAFAATMRSQMIRTKKQEKKLTEIEEALFIIGKPLGKFLLTGFFGGTKQRTLMALLETKFTHFYQTLYRFDAQEAANNSERLKEHINNSLKELFSAK